MGLIGMLITVLIMVLGTGYYFFGTSKSSIVVDNTSSAPIVQELNQAKPVIDTARDVKSLVEQKAVEVSQQLTDNNQQKTINNKQITENLPTEQTGSQQPTDNNQQIIGELKIANRLMSTGFSVPGNPRTIDTIVIHSSYNPNGGDMYSVLALVKIYESYGVSAHYLIDRKGAIYRLVEDKNIAYHAGVSKMSDGRKNVNDFSIGIEMMNTEKGQFTNAQYTAVNDLIASLKKQYKIKFVVGHNDIAPDRKTDPWNFDWKRVY